MTVLPRALLAVAVAAATLLGPMPAALALGDSAASEDYQQVVDLTFPFTADVDARFGDDYDSCRSGCARHHQATDLMVPLGTPVHAAVGGTVVWRSGSDEGPPSYGWMLRIAGDDGRAYAYVHLGEQDGPIDEAYAAAAEVGARVERGQLIGWAGCSGTATCGGGEHLHFEIHDPAVVDPYDYHDHERINPYRSLLAAVARGDHPSGSGRPPRVFDDVEPSSTHAADIVTLAEHGITRGCGSGRFCPGDTVTRQQMASFLVRALDLEAGSDSFEDVTTGNLHRSDIAALARAGITRGCGGPRFCPEAPVTRGQMASFLVRALDLDRAPAGSFGDVPTGHLHRADIDALAAAGITRGCGSGRFCPDDPVTRAQMASFLVRALDL